MKRILYPIILWLVVFSLVGLPWMARTAYYAPGHNPVFPKSLLWWDGEYGADFPWHHVHEDIKTRLRENRLHTWFDSTMDPTGIINGDQKIGGWGPFFNVLCVPAALAAVVVCLRRREWDTLVLMVCVFGPWVAFPSDGQVWSRFIMPVTLVGYVGLGRILTEVEK